MKLLFRILTRNKANAWVALLLAFIPLLLSSAIGLWAVRYEESLQQMLWWQWGLYFFAATWLMALSLAPTTFISLVSGYLLGFMALPPLVVTYLGASLLSFFLAKAVDRGRFMTTLSEEPQLQPILASLRRSELKLVILFKLSPVFPFTLSNFLLSIAHVGLKRYLLGSLLGMLPRSLLAVWMGSQVQQMAAIFQDEGKVSWEGPVILALTAVTLVWMGIIFRKAAQESLER